MKRNKHPNKKIEEVIRYAEGKGWRYKKTGNSSHGWGKLLCPLQERDGCSMSIWSTPKDAERHAKQIVRRVNACLHGKEEAK